MHGSHRLFGGVDGPPAIGGGAPPGERASPWQVLAYSGGPLYGSVRLHIESRADAQASPMVAKYLSIHQVARWLGTDRAWVLRLAREARIKVYCADGVHRIGGDFLGLLWCMLKIRQGRPKRRRRRVADPEK